MFCPACHQRLDELPQAASVTAAAPPEFYQPRTIIVDVPLSHIPLPSGPSWFFAWGGLVAVVGLLVRWYARRLAWPVEWRYSGSRESTDWAFDEALYIDLGLVLIAFGLGLVFLGIVRVSHPRGTEASM